MKKILFAIALLSGSLASAATRTSVVMYDGTLQAGTTGMHVSSGTIKNFMASTVTVSGSLTSGSVTAATISVTNLSISSFTANDLQSTNLRISTQTWHGFGILPILQIASGTVATSSNTNQSSFISSLLTVTITPKLSTSKIMVIANGPAETGAGSTGYMTILRDGTNLGNSNGLHTMSQSTNHNVTMFAYDAPATTSATTYTAAMRTDGGGSIFFPVSVGAPTCTIYAIEVAQ